MATGKSFLSGNVENFPKQSHVDETKIKYVVTLIHRMGIQEQLEAFAFYKQAEEVSVS